MVKIWQLLCSARLAVGLLIAIAASGAVGGLIPQNLSPEQYLQLYSQRTYHLLNGLSLLTIFSSFWFNSLLIILAVNLTCCTIDRYPQYQALFSSVPQALPGEYLTDRFELPDQEDFHQERFMETITRSFAPPRITRRGEALEFFAEKGRYGELGFLITHTSILIIFAGVLVGNFLGFKGFLEIRKGETVSKASLGAGQVRELGFEVQAEEFKLLHHVSGIREFVSKLSLLEAGQTVMNATVKTNRPLVYKGISLYQASYRQEEPSFHLTVVGPGQKEMAKLKASLLQKKPLPNSPLSFQITSYFPNYQNKGPALKLLIFEVVKEPKPIYLFLNEPGFYLKGKNRWTFVFQKVQDNFSVRFNVNKDPGLLLVWAGFALLFLGVLASLLFSHRQIWVRVEQENGRKIAMLAGTSFPERSSFTGTLHRLRRQLKHHENGRPLQGDEGRGPSPPKA